MLLVMLCQGLIFESDGQVEMSAVSGFGLLIVVLLVGALGITLTNFLRRLISGQHMIVIPQNAIHYLSKEACQELFDLHSQIQVERVGSLQIDRATLIKKIPSMQSSEILKIVEKEGFYGDIEFDKYAATIRDRHQIVDLMFLKSTIMR